MKLSYITRIAVPSRAAQSVQINAMSQAFGSETDGEFCLITPLTEQNEDLTVKFAWHRMPISRSFPLFYVRFALLSLFQAKKQGADAVFTRDIGIAFLGALFGIYSVYEVHKEPSTTVAKILTAMASRIKKINFVFISKALADYYEREYRFESDSFLIAHDGVFIEKYDELRNRDKALLREGLGLPVQKKIIMHTGSLYAGRGAELFQILLEAFPDILFVQVGGLPEDLKKWRKYYEGHQNILFVPHVESDLLIKYQLSADLLFFPMTKRNVIWWCTSPMKLFEYLASGIPILASRIGSSGEVLNEKNCIVMDPEKPETIVAGVSSYLADEIAALAKASNALAMVREKYTWQKRAVLILDFMNKKVN